MGNILSTVFGLGPIVVLIVILAVFFILGYVKAPPNTAYIISGLRKKPKVIIGKAGIKIPFLERKDELLLKQISIDIKTNGFINTNDFIGVNIDAIAKVRLLSLQDVTIDENGQRVAGHDPSMPDVTRDMAVSAMKNFLNMKEKDICTALTESLQGNLREIVGTQTLKELCNNRKGFGDKVQETAQKDMNALGVYIISCNIQKVEDEQGLINALGQDNMSKIQKDASIAKANAESEVAIAQADANKAANDAQVAADLDIAKKQNDLAIEKSNLKIIADAKRAEADAVYRIKEQEQRKSIEVAQANADIAKQEREIELKQKEAAVKEQELTATIRKQAEADKYAIQQQAEADLFRQQRDAEAELFKQTKEADARKVAAEAEAYAKKQEADAIRALGEAEAEAIRAKGIAEAEAIDKKAEAMKKYGQAAMIEMIVGVLPEMARAVAEPMAQVDKISIIDSGTGAGMNSMNGFVPGALAKTMESVKEATGLDIGDIMMQNSYSAATTRNVNLDAQANIDANEKMTTEALQTMVDA